MQIIEGYYFVAILHLLKYNLWESLCFLSLVSEQLDTLNKKLLLFSKKYSCIFYIMVFKKSK